MNRQFYPGCPLYVSRGLYSHHGLYAGNGWVIDYSDPSGKISANATVRYSTLQEFANGGQVLINESLEKAATFSSHQALLRAQSRIDEQQFHLLWRNCEHFTHWCLKGQAESPQVQTAFGIASVVTIVAIVAAKA